MKELVHGDGDGDADGETQKEKKGGNERKTSLSREGTPQSWEHACLFRFFLICFGLGIPLLSLVCLS